MTFRSSTFFEPLASRTRSSFGRLKAMVWVEPGGGRESAHAQEDRPPVALEHFAERVPGGQGLHFREFRRLLHGTAHREAQQTGEATQCEGDTPADRWYLVGRQPGAHGEADAGGHGHAEGDTGEHDAAHERRTAGRRFHDIGERARQLAAQTESLQQSQRHHGHAGPCTPHRKWRHEPHAERGD
jgi:hypothetical protein